MAEIRMRPKHQITLPASIVRQANLQADDRLTVDYVNGSIILSPARAKTAGVAELMAYAGIAKGAWGDTPEQVEQTIRDVRSSWDR